MLLKKRLFFTFQCVFLSVTVNINSYAGTTLRFSEIDQKTVPVEVCEEILRTALRKLNIELVVRKLPSSRGLFMSNNGLLDGEVVRTSSIEQEYKNLRKVPVPCSYGSIYLYTKWNKTFSATTWESIPKHSLIGYRRGIKIIENNLEKHNIKNASFDSNKQALKLLDNDRIDAFISGDIMQDKFISEHNLKEIKQILPPILKTNGYIYLHKQHTLLATQLTKTLESMKKQGEIEEITRNIAFK